MKIHTTKDGSKIKLCDMTDSHLEATIRLLERKAKEGIVIRSGSGSCPCDFCYDEDDFWCDEYRLQGEAALQRMGYKDYIEERNLRKLHALVGRPHPDRSAKQHGEGE